MPITVSEIAEKISGVLDGDGSVCITGVAGILDAKAGDITFLSNQRYAWAIGETKASVVIVDRGWTGKSSCAVIRVESPDSAFVQVAGMFAPTPVMYAPGVHKTAVVANDFELEKDVSVGPWCVLEPGVKIGSGTVICAGCYVGHETVIGCECKFYPHVSIRERCKIGSRVVIHNGVVIGSDGFGYVQDSRIWKKIPQIGVVEIGDDVEIGANTTIDRARFGKTVIGNGVKIDNLVQIAHNVRIGDNTAMAAQVGIAGSATIGRNVQFGGQAGAAGHLKIGDNAVIGGKSGVTKDVPPASFVSGFPAMSHDKATKRHAEMMRLPVLRKRVTEIEKRLDENEKAGENT